VFAKNRDGKVIGGDDDWISEEEEESGYAGGLGQLGSKLSAAWGGGGRSTVDESSGGGVGVGGRNAAGGSPTVKPTSAFVCPPSIRQQKDNKGPRKGPTTVGGEIDTSLGTVVNVSADSTRPHGRGLNATRPTRIVEEDEDGEEEEEWEDMDWVEGCAMWLFLIIVVVPTYTTEGLNAAILV
jgi:hypothetical protein